MTKEATGLATTGSTWDRLGSPLRTLVWLLLIATLLAIYREAETLVANVFSVLLLFVFAAVIAIVLTPLVDTMQRLPLFRTRRGPAVLLLYLLFTGALIGLGFLIGPALVSQARQVPQLAMRVQDQVRSWGWPINLDALRSSVSEFNIATELGLVRGLIVSVISVVLVVVISIYLLIEGRPAIATLRKLFPAHTRMFDFMAVAVGSTVEAYVRGQILMSLLMGTYITVSMALLGVQYAVVLGVAAALLELVPLLGAVIAMVMATSVALLQSPELGVATVAVGLLGHALESYVVGPRISGRVTQLHPLVAMSALLVGAEVGGILGALFGVPVAAIANIVLGAAYRSRQGDAPLTTHARGKIKADTLPRLGDEIGGIDREGVVSDPVPREKP